MPSILIIDDEEAIAWALRTAFEREKHRVRIAATAEEGLKIAATLLPDVAFVDVRLPGMDGLTALAKLKTTSPETKTIIITAHGNLATAVKAVEGGAFDYLSKPFDLSQAQDAVTRALAVGNEEPSPNPSLEGRGGLVGSSAAMQTVFKRIALVAPTTAGVLVSGESGTGKELVARAIHDHSPRRNAVFLPVHVAALNPNLVESELFGHAKGAFTGADREKKGLIALASGGTLFLDELGDIPLPVQAKLLRVLERQEVYPVGGAIATPVDVRIVSASHADLGAAVAEGRFRHDLLYRLNVYPIHVPPLRDRVSDIPELVNHFLRLFGSSSSLSPDALAVLQSRLWPGNVRELRNALEHAAILARGGLIMPEHLPAESKRHALPVHERLRGLVREWTAERVKSFGGEEPSDLHLKLLDEVEPALIAEVLRQLDNNRLAAARWLGLARATLRKLIRKYELLPDGDEE